MPTVNSQPGTVWPRLVCDDDELSPEALFCAALALRALASSFSCLRRGTAGCAEGGGAVVVVVVEENRSSRKASTGLHCGQPPTKNCGRRVVRPRKRHRPSCRAGSPVIEVCGRVVRWLWLSSSKRHRKLSGALCPPKCLLIVNLGGREWTHFNAYLTTTNVNSTYTNSQGRHCCLLSSSVKM